MFSGQMHELSLSIYRFCVWHSDRKLTCVMKMNSFHLLSVPVKLLLKQNKKWFYGV